MGVWWVLSLGLMNRVSQQNLAAVVQSLQTLVLFCPVFSADKRSVLSSLVSVCLGMHLS